MDQSQFVHLHSHTEYSLLDGAARITDEKGKPGELVKKVAEMKQPALAITDHGNLYGAIEFYQACKAVNVKPIIGCEMYLAPKSRYDRTTSRGQEDAYFHFTVLAQSNEGYQNLIQLVSAGFLEGYYYKPRVDKELLAKHGKGLVILSGCLKGELANALLNGTEKQAAEIVEQYQSFVGKENYYFELMDHGLADQKRQNVKLIELSKKMGVPLVVTNDCHYLNKDDAHVHDALLCIGTGSTLAEPNRMRFDGEDFYYKSAAEMYAAYPQHEDAVRRTLEIAEKCNVEMRFDQMLLPHFDVPEGQTPDTYLEELCMQGLQKRYGGAQPKYLERLKYELSVIMRMGFATYFLIVQDFIHYAKTNGVPVGPGRGSGAGSLVAYVLEITDICPVKYQLLFERFLNPDRRSMPDLDIDFSDDGRDRVIQYVRNKYGEKSVAQIVTFGSMLARLVVRDVGRVMGMAVPEVDRIAKLIPKELGTTIQMAMDNVTELQEECRKNPEVDRLIKIGRRLEGLKRHTGVHAAGIVIAKGDLTQYVPLAKGSKDVITTQYDGDGLSKLGLLKMDFLGLRTLTVIQHACRLIRERHKPDFDIATIPLDDAPTFKLLQDAKAIGVFQLESSGMRDLLRKLHPTVFEDIIALIALYRPGPMGAGMLDLFVQRKHNPAMIKYDHPVLEPILKETYGVILYQEQVMKISMEMGGFTPGQADGLRKAMGKKIPEEIEKQRDAFMKGAVAQGIPEKIANQTFEQIVFFGGYGFNKSHSTAYGLVSYQTAFLKANYPVEYMAATLTSEIGHSAIGKEEDSKLVNFLMETESMGIRVLPPSVQKSFSDFTIEDVEAPAPASAALATAAAAAAPATGNGNGTATNGYNGADRRSRGRSRGEIKHQAAIRFGLLAVKNVGTGAVDSIVETRGKEGEFRTFEEFCQRVDLRQTNRKVLESLIKAGAFDSLMTEPPKQSRAALMDMLEGVMARSVKIREEAQMGQSSLFGWDEMAAASAPAKPSLTPVVPSLTKGWAEHELLAAEKEVLGFYLSGHPLARFQAELKLFSTHQLDKLPTGSNAAIRIAGMISSVRRMVTKAKKEPYARCRFEDLQGEIDMVVFPRAYASGISQHLKPSEMVVVTGKISRRDEGGGAPELLVEDLVPLSQAREKYVCEFIVRVNPSALAEQSLQELKGALAQFPGQCQMCFEVETNPGSVIVIETDILVKPSAAMFLELEKRLGHESWRITRIGRDRVAREPQAAF
jgi:DNA polymerase-3 subunit alpha